MIILASYRNKSVKSLTFMFLVSFVQYVNFETCKYQDLDPNVSALFYSV